MHIWALLEPINSKVYPIKVTVPQDFPSPEKKKKKKNLAQDVGKNWRSKNVLWHSLFTKNVNNFG